MKKNDKPKHVYDPIFGTNIYYFCDESANEFLKSYKRWVIKQNLKLSKILNEKEFDKDSEGVNFELDTNIGPMTIIWAPKNKPEMLAHEAFHCVVKVAEKAGINLSSETSGEFYAYYLAFIIRSYTND